MVNSDLRPAHALPVKTGNYRFSYYNWLKHLILPVSWMVNSDKFKNSFLDQCVNRIFGSFSKNPVQFPFLSQQTVLTVHVQGLLRKSNFLMVYHSIFTDNNFGHEIFLKPLNSGSAGRVLYLSSSFNSHGPITPDLKVKSRASTRNSIKTDNYRL